jgi:GNAT superfamily N-acetyltransferase
VTPPSVRLVDLGPDDDLFPAWCGVWTAGQLLDRPEDPPRPAQEHVALAHQLLTPGGSRAGTHRAAMVDGAVVGALRVIVPLKDNPTVAILDVGVHPDHRRRGIGTTLLADGIQLVRRWDRTELVAEIDEPGPGTAGRAFAQHHGWSCDLVETRRDLTLPVEETTLTALETEARKAGGDGYRIVTWRDRTPEEFLADRALLERRMTTDAPHGDLPVEEEHWDGDRIREYEAAHLARGRTVLSAGAVAGGRLVAFTDLQIQLASPERANQAGTLVLTEHRGHRLGARLKIAVLREVMAGFPAVRRISTYNSESNRPMVAVNEALGFRPAGSLTSWSMRV